MQLFEFLLTIVGSAKLVKVSLDNFKLVGSPYYFLPLLFGSKNWFLQVIASNVRELVYHTIAFLQMTEQQVIIFSICTFSFLCCK